MTEAAYLEIIDNAFDLELFLTKSPIREEGNDLKKVLTEPYFSDLDDAYIYNGYGLESCFVNFPFQGPRESHKFNFILNQMVRFTKKVNNFDLDSIFNTTMKEVYPPSSTVALMQSALAQVNFREYVILNNSRERWYGV